MTAYVINGDKAAVAEYPSLLRVSCQSGFSIESAQWAEPAGMISMFGESDAALVAARNAAVVNRGDVFEVTGEEVHIHLLIDDLYGAINLEGPGVNYNQALDGLPKHPHLEGDAGTYALEAPVLAHPEGTDGLLAVAYGGFSQLSPASVDTVTHTRR